MPEVLTATCYGTTTPQGYKVSDAPAALSFTSASTGDMKQSNTYTLEDCGCSTQAQLLEAAAKICFDSSECAGFNLFAVGDLKVVFKTVGLESLEESADDSVFFYALQDVYTAVLDDGDTSTDGDSGDEAEYTESDSGCSGTWCAISTFERCKTAATALSRSVHLEVVVQLNRPACLPKS